MNHFFRFAILTSIFLVLLSAFTIDVNAVEGRPRKGLDPSLSSVESTETRRRVEEETRRKKDSTKIDERRKNELRQSEPKVTRTDEIQRTTDILEKHNTEFLDADALEAKIKADNANAIGNDIGITSHYVDQKINRRVRSSDVRDALKSPLDVKPVKLDNEGRPSQRYVGEKAEAVLNPETKKIVSVNPTGYKKAERLLRQQESNK